MKKLFRAVGVVLVALFAVSCAPKPPSYRISQRPEAYERLSEKHKQLVSKGEIAEGMEKAAVALAWGSPSDQVEGLRKGKRMDRWDYRSSKPVVTNNFYGGYGYGGCVPYRYSGIGASFGPQVTYVPYRKATVWFINGRVEEWQREAR